MAPMLEPGDVILVDTGCRIDGYHSDLTRTYMLDGGDDEFERAWAIKREGQEAVFEAAKLGASCESLDAAARNALAQHGLGPDYRLPGLPHRAGHGLRQNQGHFRAAAARTFDALSNALGYLQPLQQPRMS